MIKANLFWDCIEILHSYKVYDVVSYHNAKIAEKIVLSSCDSSRQVKAVASGIIKYLKEEDIIYSVEGMEEGNWVLIDLSTIIFHIFRNDVRSYYDIDNFLSN